MTIAVAVNVHEEGSIQVEECLRRIRQNLRPDHARVILNGVSRPDVIEMSSRFEFQAEQGPNYGSNTYWNLWWLRMLRFFNEVNADICFKFDPDTMVDATPKMIPTAPYFGDVWRSRLGGLFVQGGITGLNRKAVNYLRDSKLLEKDLCEVWTRGIPVSRWLMDDQYIGIALGKIGIYPAPWKECKSAWRVPLQNELGRYAIVHPRYYGREKGTA